MTAPSFAGLPRGTRLRMAAVAVLANAGTLVGGNVRDSPRDAIEYKDYPALALYSMERRDTIAAAGGPPAMKITYTLTIQGLVISADASRATLLADILKQQALDALLSDAIWPGLVESISSIEETRKYGADGERKIEEFQLAISTAWRDVYTPDNFTPLLAGGQPAALRIVAVPLEKIVNSATLDTDTQGHPTIFVIDTAIPQD